MNRSPIGPFPAIGSVHDDGTPAGTLTSPSRSETKVNNSLVPCVAFLPEQSSIESALLVTLAITAGLYIGYSFN